MKIKVPEAEILRTPMKIEKLSLWNGSRSQFNSSPRRVLTAKETTEGLTVEYD